MIPHRRAFTPKFSVVMAKYNNDLYVGHASQSVISQTFQDWELIFADDHSSVGSVMAIEPFLRDDQICFFRNERNTGYIRTPKRLISLSCRRPARTHLAVLHFVADRNV